MRQVIFKRHEISIGEELMSLREAITQEFMAGFSTLKEAALSDQCVNVISVDRQDIKALEEVSKFLTTKNLETGKWEPCLESWRAVGFKFTREDDVKPVYLKMDEEQGKKFPTAYNLMKKYNDICPMMSINIIAPRTILHRHYGPENPDGKYIRIHVPLIVPKGDIFLEVGGEEVTWDDLFGFDNTILHSAHNYSDEYRMILLFDIDRVAIGMSPGLPFDQHLHDTADPFVRGWKW